MSHNTRRTRRSREAKVERQTVASLASSKQPQGVSLELIDTSQADRIHQAVLQILWRVGVIIEHRETRNNLVRNCGAQEDTAGYLHLPSELVERTLESLPDHIVLYDQDGEVRVDTRANIPSYCPGHNCVRVLNFRNGELRPLQTR